MTSHSKAQTKSKPPPKPVRAGSDDGSEGLVEEPSVGSDDYNDDDSHRQKHVFRSSSMQLQRKGESDASFDTFEDWNPIKEETWNPINEDSSSHDMNDKIVPVKTGAAPSLLGTMQRQGSSGHVTEDDSIETDQDSAKAGTETEASSVSDSFEEQDRSVPTPYVVTVDGDSSSDRSSSNKGPHTSSSTASNRSSGRAVSYPTESDHFFSVKSQNNDSFRRNSYVDASVRSSGTRSTSKMVPNLTQRKSFQGANSQTNRLIMMHAFTGGTSSIGDLPQTSQHQSSSANPTTASAPQSGAFHQPTNNTSTAMLPTHGFFGVGETSGAGVVRSTPPGQKQLFGGIMPEADNLFPNSPANPGADNPSPQAPSLKSSASSRKSKSQNTRESTAAAYFKPTSEHAAIDPRAYYDPRFMEPRKAPGVERKDPKKRSPYEGYADEDGDHRLVEPRPVNGMNHNKPKGRDPYDWYGDEDADHRFAETRAAPGLVRKGSKNRSPYSGYGDKEADHRFTESRSAHGLDVKNSKHQSPYSAYADKDADHRFAESRTAPAPQRKNSKSRSPYTYDGYEYGDEDAAFPSTRSWGDDDDLENQDDDDDQHPPMFDPRAMSDPRLMDPRMMMMDSPFAGMMSSPFPPGFMSSPLQNQKQKQKRSSKHPKGRKEGQEKERRKESRRKEKPAFYGRVQFPPLSSPPPPSPSVLSGSTADHRMGGGSTDPRMMDPRRGGGSVDPRMMDPRTMDPRMGGSSTDPRMMDPRMGGGSIDPRMMDPRMPGGMADPRMMDPRMQGGMADPHMMDPRMHGGMADPRMMDPRMLGGMADPRMMDPRMSTMMMDPRFTMDPRFGYPQSSMPPSGPMGYYSPWGMPQSPTHAGYPPMFYPGYPQQQPLQPQQPQVVGGGGSRMDHSARMERSTRMDNSDVSGHSDDTSTGPHSEVDGYDATSVAPSVAASVAASVFNPYMMVAPSYPGMMPSYPQPMMMMMHPMSPTPSPMMAAMPPTVGRRANAQLQQQFLQQQEQMEQQHAPQKPKHHQRHTIGGARRTVPSSLSGIKELSSSGSFRRLSLGLSPDAEKETRKSRRWSLSGFLQSRNSKRSVVAGDNDSPSLVSTDRRSSSRTSRRSYKKSNTPDDDSITRAESKTGAPTEKKKNRVRLRLFGKKR